MSFLWADGDSKKDYQVFGDVVLVSYLVKVRHISHGCSRRGSIPWAVYHQRPLSQIKIPLSVRPFL
ncbi:hypothetical protein ACLOJK_028740 [Asimina triloba]